MLLAGLGVDLSAAKEYIYAIVKLTFIPMVAEVAIVATLSHFLVGMPWVWGLLLGCIVTAISPNVVVTVVLSLKEQKLGSNIIHTIILAVTTFNDVLAIFCSGVLLGIIFNTGQLRNQILQGPVSIGIGIIFGGVYGFFMGHLPSNYSVGNGGRRNCLFIYRDANLIGISTSSTAFQECVALRADHLRRTVCRVWQQGDRFSCRRSIRMCRAEHHSECQLEVTCVRDGGRN